MTEMVMTEAAPHEMSHWQKVVVMVQAVFQEGQMVEDTMCQAVALIPKGGVDYRSIGLVELVWKVVIVVLDH